MKVDGNAKVDGDQKIKNGQSKTSVAALCDSLTRKHISPLSKELNKIAKQNGGEGELYFEARQAMNSLIVALRQMREGKQ
jgi:hypothetical protein